MNRGDPLDVIVYKISFICFTLDHKTVKNRNYIMENYLYKELIRIPFDSIQSGIFLTCVEKYSSRWNNVSLSWIKYYPNRNFFLLNIQTFLTLRNMFPFHR
jgi:hypothetical protein